MKHAGEKLVKEGQGPSHDREGNVHQAAH